MQIHGFLSFSKIVFPYLRTKLDDFYRKQIQNSDEQQNRSIFERILRFYPFFDSIVEALIFCFQLLYLFGRTRY